MKKYLDARYIIIASLILVAALTRLIPHPPNFTPIMALGLFGGAYFSDKRFAFLVPLAAMFISDIIIGFHPTIWAVYFSLVLGTFIGKLIINKINFSKIVIASITSSIIFFIITNFAHWLTFYPLTTDTFIKCYIDAIPFFRNTFFGDLTYCGVLFGSFSVAEKYVPSLAKISN